MRRKDFCHFCLTVHPAAGYEWARVVNINDSQQSFRFLAIVDSQTRDFSACLRPAVTFELIMEVGAVQHYSDSLDVVFESPVSSKVHVANAGPSPQARLTGLKDAVENVARNSGDNLRRQTPGGMAGSRY